MPHRPAYLLPVLCSLAIASAPADAQRTATQALAASGPSVASGAAGPSSAESKAWWSEPPWSELPNTVLDKGLLALVVAYAGFVLNGALERLKSEESLSSGLTDIRLKKAGEMSEAAYVWEWEVVAAVEQLRRDVAKYPNAAAQADEVRKFASERALLIEDGRKCLSTLARDRFWVGDVLYNRFNAFYSRVSEALDKVVDVQGLEDFQAAFEKNHVSAAQAMDAFIAEHVRMRAQWSAASKIAR